MAHPEDVSQMFSDSPWTSAGKQMENSRYPFVRLLLQTNVCHQCPDFGQTANGCWTTGGMRDIFPVMMDVFSRMTVLFFHAGQISSPVEQKCENDGPTVEHAGHSRGTPEGFCRIPSRRQRRTSVSHPLPFSREIRRFLKKVWLKKSDRLNRAEAML
jgi:hypothetical protein